MASVVDSSANLSPLKRSFDHVDLAAESTSYYAATIPDPEHYVERGSIILSSTVTTHASFRYTKRRNSSVSSFKSMLAQSTTVMSGSFPSFMSVYGNEDNNIYNHALSEPDTKPQQFAFSHLTASTNRSTFHSQPPYLERRASLTSATSCSTGSSPTTTDSTFDSPLMADQSPDSSPESASSVSQAKLFKQSNVRSTGTQTLDFPGIRQAIAYPITIPASEQCVEEPKRNQKKLTLDMKLPTLLRSGIGSDPESQPLSVPGSPFREPLKTGRRKPTNLSIRTPGFNQLSFGINALAIPPTPGQKPVLQQAQLSPSLPSLASPSMGPVDGMRLNLPSIAQNFAREPFNNNNGTTLVNNLPSLREEPYQPPQSQEAPEKGYTEGPCLIYDAGVYLYLEPTAAEAANFDVVINVAKEIKNPFEGPSSDQGTVMSVWRNTGNRQSIPEPQTATSEISFRSAFEWPSGNDQATPTTPKPASSPPSKQPEYLHVKWDHNSEILDDLLPLCQLIDDRVQQSKKVLIHCQLGVSRSASLIIAYGLYKGYEPDFHAMYMAVKKRSQWVGPNMSLIYQLTDFKSKCDKGAYAESKPKPKSEWFLCGSENADTPTAQSQPTTVVPSVQPKMPAESQHTLRLNKELPPVPPNTLDQNLSTQLAMSTRPENPRAIKLSSLVVNGREKAAQKAVPRVLPFRAMGYSNQDMTIPPHRPRIPPGLTFSQPSMDLAMQDVPAVPSLFSPRATEFTAAPFGVTAAGDLATSAQKSIIPPPGAFPGGTEWRNSLFFNYDAKSALPVTSTVKPEVVDPRSPHQLSEPSGRFGSIDGVL